MRIYDWKSLFTFATGRSRGQVPFANLGGGARANAELPVNENVGQTSPPPVSFSDIMTVFKRAVREVKAGQTALEAGEARGGDTTYFNRTIVILLHLVCLLTKLIPHLEKDKVGYSKKFDVNEIQKVKEFELCEKNDRDQWNKQLHKLIRVSLVNIMSLVIRCPC